MTGRITTPVRECEAIALVGAAVAEKVRTGYYRRGTAVGPVGTGRLTWNGRNFCWERNPATVHSDYRRFDAATR